MEAILFVGHGSREQAGNEQLVAFTQQVEEILRGQSDVPIYETCFLELTTPTIATGIRRCVERGATRVALVPLMLFSAGHAKIHIPHEIDEAKEKYPHVTFTYGRPFGVHEKMMEIVQDRLSAVQAEVAAASAENATDIAKEETAILLVGRGSSDPDANSDMYKIGRLLWESAGVAEVELAFMGVTRPTLEEGLERSLRGGMKKVIVMPYLLFTGVLMNRLRDAIEAFREKHPGVAVEMTEFLGFHEQLAHLTAERAMEALEGRAVGNCDMCVFRKMAPVDHHHHHHDHDHDHHHDHDHSHDHSHEHTHSHSCDHSHEHNHSHSHDHSHEHTHSHSCDHSHDHSHDHKDGHDHHPAKKTEVSV
ncbi:sirohydrochlorin chelatase [Brevibacillus dissolubilis]|uniref:sirohydrochlorin chelatase n=1 Tax=Brevibacillus dissolubilis TaxID=1844116 RepID=UPI001117AAAD|nr:sirohydrochlorin chelatase [Brevibacillus dissolubilis]